MKPLYGTSDIFIFILFADTSFWQVGEQEVSGCYVRILVLRTLLGNMGRCLI